MTKVSIALTLRKKRALTALAYVAISMSTSALFFFAATSRGSSQTDIYLGMVWVFALSAIVSASLLPQFLDRLRVKLSQGYPEKVQ